MLSMKALIRFLDRGFIIKLLLVVMLFSLIPFGECLLILLLNNYVPTFILLSLVAGTSLVGFTFVVRPLSSALQTLHASIDDGYYPEEQFAILAGTLVAAAFLVTPGFITDALGMILLVRVFRRGAGKLVTYRMRDRLLKLYEYIKLYER